MHENGLAQPVLHFAMFEDLTSLEVYSRGGGELGVGAAGELISSSKMTALKACSEGLILYDKNYGFETSQ